MEYTRLGTTGVQVSRLCFGTLTLSPLQKNMPPEQGAELMIYALDQGITFFDTAQLYDNYPALRLLLRSRPQAIIATKCYAYDQHTAQAAYAEAAKVLGRDYIDLMLLHEQESDLTLRGHMQALEYFHTLKERGHIGAVGISTHHVAAVRAALRYPQVEVLHPLVNQTGIGIVDGTADQMLAAIGDCYAAGKGIYAMKPLGGGHLIGRRAQAFEYILGRSCIHSVAVGMATQAEVDYNIAVFEGRKPDESLRAQVDCTPRKLLIHDWCRGCGQCVQRCPQKALYLQQGKAHLREEYCIRCGYCAPTCPDFCIKIV